MVELRPVALPEGTAIGIEVDLPNTHLAILVAGSGYVMCGALDVRGLDERLAARRIVAGRAVGVGSVEELLAASLESVTQGMASLGIRPGEPVTSALRKLLAAQAD